MDRKYSKKMNQNKNETHGVIQFENKLCSNGSQNKKDFLSNN